MISRVYFIHIFDRLKLRFENVKKRKTTNMETLDPKQKFRKR